MTVAMESPSRTVATPIEESLRVLRKLVSPYTGIVRVLFDLLTLPGDPKMWYAHARLANPAMTLGGGVSELTGGINPSRERAVAAALGEAAERYSLFYVPQDELRFAAARDLDGPYLAPQRLQQFLPEQYEASSAFVCADERTPLQWTQARNLLTAERTWIPSQYCYLPDHRVSGEPLITYNSSSGTACALTYEEALLCALYELVERDAFMCAWYSRLSLPLIEPMSCRELREDHERYYRDTGVSYAGIDVSAFLGIPAAIVVAHDKAGFINCAVGAASARTMVDAMRKATREAFQTYRWARQRHVVEQVVRPENYADVRTFEDHVLFYAFERKEEVAFLTASPQRRQAEEVPALSGPAPGEQIEAILAHFRARNIDVYAIDVTAPDVRDLGLHVVRALSPDLAQLDVDYNFRFLGLPRLRTAAYDAGLRSAPLEIGDLNPAPHPFP